jgi:DNA-binding CsgD family transcriptional regulator
VAAERGAPEEAAVLARQALRLTPRGSPEAAARVIMLAECRLVIGDHAGTRSLLTTYMDELPAGPVRAQALMLRGLASDVSGELADVEAALVEGGDDPEIRADGLKRKAIMFALSDVRRLDEAEIWSGQALEAAKRCGPAVELRALYALDWVRVMRGKPIIEPPGSEAVPHSLRVYEESIDRPRGVRAAFRGETDDARRIFQDLRERSEMRGELRAEAGMVIQLCELELRCGNIADAARRLDELDEYTEMSELVLTQIRLEALLAIMSGNVAEGVRRANVALGRGRDVPVEWDRIETRRALGLCALFENEAERAVDIFGEIWDMTRREHIDDPGAFPVAGDLVEMLAVTGDIGRADAVLTEVSALAEAQDHPWAKAVVRRGRAFLALQAGMDDNAVEEMEAAARTFDELGLRFDGARTHLQLGRLLRRYKKSGAARRALNEAASGFDRLGCRGWAEQARTEVSRLGGRRPTPRKELTPSEAQVAELAARGLTNKAIAQQLYLSVYTVEQHLSKAYSKLGVRSRSQLAGRLAGPDER